MSSAESAGGQPPGRPPGGVKTSPSFQPTKDLVFNVTVPADASVVSVIDAVADVVGLPNVYMVVAVERPATVDRPTVRNGHRIVQIEMKPEKPCYESAAVCKKSRPLPGKDCKEDFCDRCSTFGHTTASCTAKCRRCRGDHATADCVKPRSFAEVLAGRERRQRSVAMEEDGGNDGSTPPSSTVSAEEPAAPSHNEANPVEPEAQASPPPLHVTATDSPQATPTGTEHPSESSSCSSPQPLVIVEDESSMETNEEEEQLHHSKADDGKNDEAMDSDSSVSSSGVKVARAELRRAHQTKRMKKEPPQLSDDEDK
ncbi:hypothetical protein HPB48_001147 [Haemaphysalis longicornis]|uniref:Uncharacterized protein n=1 Tax=Haemaphysalis longicornis TaxID=44386 RepID=A0A9J6FL58_HAELO|nr:hypothetical protein HPB48_001147 [Haemaphysalis longicornis]